MADIEKESILISVLFIHSVNSKKSDEETSTEYKYNIQARLISQEVLGTVRPTPTPLRPHAPTALSALLQVFTIQRGRNGLLPIYYICDN